MITPGTWQVSAGALLRVVVKGTGVVVCGVHRIGIHGSRRMPAEQRQALANARLIAAAPEMRAALTALAEASRSAVDARQHAALIDALFDADAVLAKANGDV